MRRSAPQNLTRLSNLTRSTLTETTTTSTNTTNKKGNKRRKGSIKTLLTSPLSPPNNINERQFYLHNARILPKVVKLYWNTNVIRFSFYFSQFTYTLRLCVFARRFSFLYVSSSPHPNIFSGVLLVFTTLFIAYLHKYFDGQFSFGTPKFDGILLLFIINV